MSALRHYVAAAATITLIRSCAVATGLFQSISTCPAVRRPPRHCFMVCFCYRRRFVAPPRLNADGEFIRRTATGCYQEAGLLASATVSPHSFPPKNNTGFSKRAGRPKDKPRPGRPGLKNGRLGGGVGGCLPSNSKNRSCRWWLRRRRLLV